MGAPGKKPTPNYLKVVSGSRRQNPDAPDGTGRLKPPPRSWPADMKKLWREIVDAAPHGVLTESDRLLIEISVRNLKSIRDGEVLTAAQSAEMRRCLGEMGMTPAERGRLCAQKPAARNPFEDL